MEILPTKFFSNSFIELNKSKDFYEVCKTQEIGKINEFEEKFSEINNYYEQFDSFKRFVEYNSGLMFHLNFHFYHHHPNLKVRNQVLDFYNLNLYFYLIQKMSHPK